MVRPNAARFACPADHLEVRDMLHGLQPCLVIKRVEVPAVSPASYNNGRAKCQSSQNPVHKTFSRNAKNTVSLSENNGEVVNIYRLLSLIVQALLCFATFRAIGNSCSAGALHGRFNSAEYLRFVTSGI